MEFSQKLLEEDEDIDSSDTDSSTTIEENDPEPTYFSLDEEIDTSLFTPLYEDAPLSVAASLQAIMGFSLGNHLSYSAMDQLLDLLKLHVPSTCGLPKSLNRLKRQFFIDEPQPLQRFCSNCFVPVKKKCVKRSCSAIKAEVCFYVPVPIISHLKQIVAGMFSVHD